LLKRHLELLNQLRLSKKPFFVFLDYSMIQNSVKINVSKKYNNFSKEYFEKKDENLVAYDSYLAEADNYLGKILDKIDDLNFDDSILIVNSDHGIGSGEKFGEKSYGVYCYDYTLRTFALFKNSLIFPQKEIKQLVRTIDIMPTILDYLGIKAMSESEKMDGKSMRNLIDGEEEERISFSESGNPYPDPKIPPKKPNVRVIRTSKWKFIKNYWNDSEELYDLEKDPEEIKNLISKNPDIAKEMRKKLNFELKEGLKVKINKLKKNSE
ncbi:MAG: sulfatase-like hydrolase/transferase, partial [Candidatus Pacearchaeota archaeon]|nr:sulfatase-like hydrolase/transferase [Candidatus Pacearchaeota archaeon]